MKRMLNRSLHYPPSFLWVVAAALVACTDDRGDAVAVDPSPELIDEVDPSITGNEQELYLGEDQRRMTAEEVRRTVSEYSGFTLPEEIIDLQAIHTTAERDPENLGESIVLRISPEAALDLFQSSRLFWEDADADEVRTYVSDNPFKLQGLNFREGKRLWVRDYSHRIELNLVVDVRGTVWFHWARLSI
jgi:hypothetical protein